MLYQTMVVPLPPPPPQDQGNPPAPTRGSRGSPTLPLFLRGIGKRLMRYRTRLSRETAQIYFIARRRQRYIEEQADDTDRQVGEQAKGLQGKRQEKYISAPANPALLSPLSLSTHLRQQRTASPAEVPGKTDRSSHCCRRVACLHRGHLLPSAPAAAT